MGNMSIQQKLNVLTNNSNFNLFLTTDCHMQDISRQQELNVLSQSEPVPRSERRVN